MAIRLTLQPDLKAVDDSTLVAMVRAGSADAFAVLDERYRLSLTRYCSGLAGPVVAEDLVQQAFTNAFTAMTSSQAELKMKPWLWQIAHNVAVDYLRSAPASHLQLSEDYDGVAQPPQQVARLEKVREVVQGILELPARQRRALVMCELEGRTQTEVASILHTNRASVKHLVYRARRLLRDKLAGFLPLPWLLRRPQLVNSTLQGGGGELVGAFKVAAIAALAAFAVVGDSGVKRIPPLGSTGYSPGYSPRLVDQSVHVAPSTGSRMDADVDEGGKTDKPDSSRARSGSISRVDDGLAATEGGSQYAAKPRAADESSDTAEQDASTASIHDSALGNRLKQAGSESGGGGAPGAPGGDSNGTGGEPGSGSAPGVPSGNGNGTGSGSSGRSADHGDDDQEDDDHGDDDQEDDDHEDDGHGDDGRDRLSDDSDDGGSLGEDEDSKR